MNTTLSIETAAMEAPNPQASDTKAPSPEEGGAFDLMLSQLMQTTMSLPVQTAFPITDRAAQAEAGMATTLPIDSAAVEMSSMSLLTTPQTIQSVFVATLAAVLNGVAAKGVDIFVTGQAVQAEKSMAATLPVDGAVQEMVSMSPLTSLQTNQSIFFSTIKDVPDSVASKGEALTGGSRRQAETALQAALFSDISDQTTAAADEGINPELSFRPDSKEGQMAGQKNAQLVQMPSDAVKEAPAIEVQPSPIMREIILAEGANKDMVDLPEAQRRLEETSLPETLPANNSGPQGMIRIHGETADSPAAVSNAHHLSESMRVEGNRFVITRLDGTSIEISLQPEGLGKLDIGLVLDKGVVNAQIQASSAAGKELIERHMNDIVTALAQEGISIGGFSVSLKDNRNDFAESQGQGFTQMKGEPVLTKEYISIPGQLIDQGMVSIFI